MKVTEVTSVVQSNDIGWSARDYVVGRRFCPPETIEATLSSYMHAVGASELIVLTHHTTIFLESLCYFHHNGSSDGQALAKLCSAASLRRRDPFAQDALWADSDSTPEQVLQDLRRPGLFENASAYSLIELILECHGSRPWKLVSEPAPNPGNALGCALLVRQRKDLDAPLPLREQSITDLLTMVNGTVQASIFRDRLVQHEIESTLGNISAKHPGAVTTDILPELIEMAQRVTQSNAAAVYFLDSSSLPAERRLVAAFRTSTDVASCPSIIPLADDRYKNGVLAAAAFSRNRPLLLDKERHSSAPHPTYSSTGEPLEAEIALPIPSAPGTSVAPNAGVLVLCRSGSPHSGPYGNYELALLRNVVLRIALIRSALHLEEAGDAVARVGRMYAAAEPTYKASEAPLTSEWSGPHEAAGIVPLAEMPDDFRDAIPIVAGTVSIAGRLTGASSATLRLLTLGSDGAHKYSELVLRRAIAWPAWRVGDEHHVIRLTDPSINAWVARTGVACDVEDVTNLPDPRYPGLERCLLIEDRRTGSELCVPVVVDRRVVGTLNLEADRIGAFAFHTSVAAACAVQVGIAIAAVRRKSMQTVLSIGSDVQASAHEIAGLSDRLRELHDSADASSLRVGIGKARETLAEIVTTMRFASSAEGKSSSPHVATLVDTLRTAAAAAGLELRLLSVDASDLKWSPTMQRRVYLALYAIFDNASIHGSVGALGYPRVYGSVQEIGGRRYLDLQIVNRLRKLLRPAVTSLYRQPISGDDRMHFGAYLAGAMLRSVGGDVYARVAGGRDMMTVLSIPYESPEAL